MPNPKCGLDCSSDISNTASAPRPAAKGVPATATWGSSPNSTLAPAATSNLLTTFSPDPLPVSAMRAACGNGEDSGVTCSDSLPFSARTPVGGNGEDCRTSSVSLASNGSGGTATMLKTASASPAVGVESGAGAASAPGELKPTSGASPCLSVGDSAHGSRPVAGKHAEGISDLAPKMELAVEDSSVASELLNCSAASPLGAACSSSGRCGLGGGLSACAPPVVCFLRNSMNSASNA
mmetsp:Transcript_1588/g.2872  ORF Transcript_1588/g.2872 Transcript_1588/m.2872 type:complete len:237 (-) Transcript_1588:925-1635(-)